MKKHILVYILGIVVLPLWSQNDIDAMRYSQITFGGTARFASMAGSMGALGGDISTLSFNPAGIAVFRKTELSITPSVFSQTTTSDYNGRSASDRKLNFNLGNIGFVATFKLNEEKSKGWQTINIGVGYNRTNNFHNRILVEGYNKNSSLLDTYVADANGYSDSEFDQFSTGLAWSTWLINPLAGDSIHYDHVIKNYGQLQRKSVESRGSMGETAISFGANYDNKLFLGGTIGVVRVRYNEEAIFEEIDTEDTISGFKSFAYTQNLNTQGSGINMKLGAIFKPTDWLRIGAAVHTPTSITLSDDYSSSMKSDLESVRYEEQSESGKFDYTVTTPFRAILSSGFVINKIAVLNAEYEYVDYSYAQLSSRPNVFAEVNSMIRSNYTSTNNLRFGGEFRFDPFAVRLGYALYGSPFKNGDNKTASRSSYTGGIGYRSDNYFIDFAYVYTAYQQNSYLYNPDISEPVKSKYTNSSFMLSMGVRF
ncbi:MAG: outer membrane protein transport protein [Bacteroidia bacterium]|nr:outer membrane protein transport protein [Bacteroidia bacterium]